jgi:hypothetical protein
MKVDDIIYQFVNARKEGKESHTRKIGRYWSSEINSIKGGYVTPKNFFEEKQKDISGCKMILSGIAMEDMLTKIFTAQKIDFMPQEKKEIKINDEIVLVVKPDFVFPTMVIETKFPFSISESKTIPERYLYQLECTYRAFPDKKVYVGLFSVPFNVELIEYVPSLKRWKNIQNLIITFHEELKKLYPLGTEDDSKKHIL